MEFDVNTLTLVVGTLIPLLVGLVTKEVANSGLKGVLNALLSAVAGALTVLVDNGGVLGPWQELANAGFATFITSIATYYGVWKPTGVATSVQRKTARVGVGGTVQTKTARLENNRI